MHEWGAANSVARCVVAVLLLARERSQDCATGTTRPGRSASTVRLVIKRCFMSGAPSESLDLVWSE